MARPTPLALGAAKGLVAARRGFDRLSPNGKLPFALSLSKGRVTVRRRGINKPSPAGMQAQT
jgi:hypothetical protein